MSKNINAKIRIFSGDYPHQIQDKVNSFLDSIDIRQVIKTETLTFNNKFNIIIYYIKYSDIRSSKLDSILS